MSFLQSLAKTGASTSNSTTQNDNAKIWADRHISTAASSSSSEFRTTGSSKITRENEFDNFLNSEKFGDEITGEAVGPHCLLDSTFSPEIEFQESIDGLDVVGLLEVMDTQETDMEALMMGRGGEKSMGSDEEVEDPVEWLGLSTGEYTEEVWGEVDKKKKGKSKGKEVAKERKKGKGKGMDMKSRL